MLLGAAILDSHVRDTFGFTQKRCHYRNPQLKDRMRSADRQLTTPPTGRVVGNRHLRNAKKLRLLGQHSHRRALATWMFRQLVFISAAAPAVDCLSEMKVSVRQNLPSAADWFVPSQQHVGCRTRAGAKVRSASGRVRTPPAGLAPRCLGDCRGFCFFRIIAAP